MALRIVLLLASVFLAISPTTVLLAAEWYVDDSVSASGSGKSLLTAFKTIQEGINAASEGDTVIVVEGTYNENIVFTGANIILTSKNPDDVSVRNSTIIDGGSASAVVNFSGEEDGTCVLRGFTIRKGDSAGESAPAGIEGNVTHATIEKNLITGKRGGLARCYGTIQQNFIIGNEGRRDGGGLFLCGGTIRENTISGNTAVRDGGGLHSCNGLIARNTIAGNAGGRNGGGLHNCGGDIRDNEITGNLATDGGGLHTCNGTISGNLIRGNGARGGEGADGGGLFWCRGAILWNTIEGNSCDHDGGGLVLCSGIVRNNTIHGNSAGHAGGGLYGCAGTIENNAIRENSAGMGGGLSHCDFAVRSNVIVGNAASERFVGWGNGGGLNWCSGMIENNTIVGNTADSEGGGLDRCYGTTRNCIIWGNAAVYGQQIANSTTPRFSCIQNWTGAGEGNTARAPLFVDSDGPDNDPTTYHDNNYRLWWINILPTACIDKGENQAWMQSAKDMDGNLRIYYGLSSMTVDIGAYEYGSWLFKVVRLLKTPSGETTLTWRSRPGDVYVVWSRPALYYPGPIHVPWGERDVVLSNGLFTSWTDPGLPYPALFYRVELKP